MRIYPALKGTMGFWDYYTVRMRFKDLVDQVNFATDVSEDKTLEDALQRQLNEGRSKKDIAKYLATRKDRFFNAVVVAALDGNPQYYPIKIDTDAGDTLMKMLSAQNLHDHFGIVTFDNTIKTFALDGQHRLAAIKSVLDPDDGEYYDPKLADETIAVVFVIPPKDMNYDQFKQQYRNIFTALNRHAKPMDKAMVIIMDEVDRFAIVTRKLIQEYEPFQWTDDSSPRINTKKPGKNVTENDPYFMNIVTLYDVNRILLWNEDLISEHGAKITDHYIQEIADEDEIGKFYLALNSIWDGIRIAFPALLTTNPSDLRRHDHEFDDGQMDHLFAWPIGQENILAPIVRQLLNSKGIVWASDAKEVAEAISPLTKINWDLQHPLWKFFVLVLNPKTHKMTMRSEDRKLVMNTALAIVQWLVGIHDLSEEQIEALKTEWASLLRPEQNDDLEDEIFNDLKVLRNKILS